MSERDKIIEVLAKAGASFEEVEYDKFSELFIEQAEHMLAALDKSGLAVVPVEDVRRMRKALDRDIGAAARRMLGPIEPDGSYAVDGFFTDAALVARALLSTAEDVEPGLDNDPQRNSVENEDAARIESQTSKRGQHFVD